MICLTIAYWAKDLGHYFYIYYTIFTIFLEKWEMVVAIYLNMCKHKGKYRIQVKNWVCTILTSPCAHYF